MRRKKTKGKGKSGQTTKKLILVFALFIIFADILALLGVIDISDIFEGKRKTLDLSKADVYVNFIDVGQGDCIFIQASGRNILIDAGERDQGTKVVSYLRDAGVDELDMIIVTHQHSDHIGGMADVIKEIGTKEILIPKTPNELTPTTNTYENFLKTVSKSGLMLTQAVAGDEYRFGDAYLKILSPSKDFEYTDLNDYSIVTQLTYEDTSFIFMGDASSAVEKNIISHENLKQVDVLKVGHHGSNTSSSKKFLEMTSPQCAVILCGADNSYNHPHNKVLERLEKNAGMILRTDIHGTIIISSDGKNIDYTVEKGMEDLTNAAA